jgi:transposase-like protein
MPATNGSLIMKEQADLEAAPFFPNFELPEVDKRRPKFHCTGERLFRDRPDVYKAVVRLIVEPGVSVRTICRECHVSDHTVRSVASREKIAIATVKKEVLSNIAHGMRLASERVIELMPEASARDALLGVGILGDKMALLSGEPTLRIDHGPPFDMNAAIRDLKEIFDEAARRGRAIKQAKATEIVVGEKNLAANAPAFADGVNGNNAEQRVLMNRDHEQCCDADNGARNVVGDVAATSVADGEVGSTGEAV